MRRLSIASASVIAVAAFFWITATAQEINDNKDRYKDKIAKASNEGEIAIKRFQVANGLDVELTAAEPLVANPVAFCIDDRGRFFVAETFRLHAGVTDNRHHKWTTDDLSSRTVADRLAMYRKHLKEKFADYGKDEDRIRLLVNTNGDGKPDKATVYSGGYSRPEDGIGSGVLARDGKVWYTNIPDLWLLQDTTGDGAADSKKSLHTGHGVHVSFLGHDTHGLIFGPDGKLYFSIGDRGFHIVTKNGVLSQPDTGAVFRCNPDGSELEIVATGFRNPQELAFDEFGNLFTGDNNADSGDKARWVHVVEGGDTGWRIGFQYLNAPPAKLGPWNAEKMWHLRHPEQPAHLLPPLAHIGSGPSGLTYHPGVSLLPEKYQRHFLLCDFRGGPGNSGIHAFQLKPKGASFKVVNRSKIIDNVLVTDADFGPDGGLYFSDWVDGWRMTMKGRIYKIFDPQRVKNAKVLEVKKLLAEGMGKRSINELVALLGHDDMRIRQRAQFALAERGAVKELAQVAAKSDNLPARLHAIWGIGQVGRGKQAAQQSELARDYLHALIKDKSDEVRAQAAKVLGWWRHYDANEPLLSLLEDASPRVRFETALTLGKIGRQETVQPILDMLRQNNDEDVYLRHAGVMALTWIEKRQALIANAKDSSKAVRLAVLLAMRRLKMPEIADFLNDADPFLVMEAARAINDEPINAALPQLAAMAGRSNAPDAFTYRALNAHFRLGKKENAVALARYAANPNASEDMRLEALRHLGNWEKPSNLDRVVGLYRPLKARPKAIAAEAVRSSLGGIFTGPNKIHAEGARVAGELGIKQVGPTLMKIVSSDERPATVRVESLRALDTLNDERAPEAMKLALASRSAALRAAGRQLLAKRNPEEALPELERVLKRGEVVEQQSAFTVLGRLKQKKADAILNRWLDKLLAGKVRRELRLDLIDAALERSDKAVTTKAKLYEARRPQSDHLAKYRETLFGGNASAGRRIFFEKSEVSCLRCHKIDNAGGNVGPELTHIAKEKDRNYLLEAIVAPSKQIAKGYQNYVLVLKNGQIKSGILKSEDKKSVNFMTAEGTMMTIAKSSIDEVVRGKSAMPEDLTKQLSRREVRDLVEYLSSLR